MLLCRQSSFWHQFPKPHWTHDKTLWTISYLFHFYKNTGCRLPHPLLLMMPGITLGKQDNVVQGFLEKISVAIIWQFPKSTALRKKRTMKQLRKKTPHFLCSPPSLLLLYFMDPDGQRIISVCKSILFQRPVGKWNGEINTIRCSLWTVWISLGQDSLCP